MRFESNILFSAAAHVTFLAAVLFLAGGNAVSRAPKQYFQVVLLRYETAAKTAPAGSKRATPTTYQSSVVDMKLSAPKIALPKIRREVEAKAIPARDKNAETKASTISLPGLKKQSAALKVSPSPIRKETADGKMKLPDVFLEDRDSTVRSERFAADIYGYFVRAPSEGIGGTDTDVSYSAPASLPSGEAGSGGISVRGDDGAGEEVGFSALDAIRAAIDKAKRYPLVARLRGMEGTVTAEFSINSRGMPEHVRIKASSGSATLDSAAKETIIRAAPFPLVDGKIEIPIAFRLRREE